jgi:hypothetical protein
MVNFVLQKYLVCMSVRYESQKYISHDWKTLLLVKKTKFLNLEFLQFTPYTDFPMSIKPKGKF